VCAACDGLDEHEKQIYEMALDFAKNEMAPNMKQWDLEVWLIDRNCSCSLPLHQAPAQM
jgi:hypothetical protein